MQHFRPLNLATISAIFLDRSTNLVDWLSTSLYCCYYWHSLRLHHIYSCLDSFVVYSGEEVVAVVAAVVVADWASIDAVAAVEYSRPYLDFVGRSSCIDCRSASVDCSDTSLVCTPMENSHCFRLDWCQLR